MNFSELSDYKVASEQIFVFAILMIISWFSPFLSFYACFIILLMFCGTFDILTVKSIGYLMAYSGSVICSSRVTFNNSDDFFNYYFSYLLFLDGNIIEGLQYYGSEIGLPIYYLMLSTFDIRSEVFLLFASSLLSSAIFVSWINKVSVRYFETAKLGPVLATSLLFFNFVVATQLTRQMVGIQCVLFSISTVGFHRLFWIVAAFMFHHYSIISFVLIQVIIRFGIIGAVGCGFIGFYLIENLSYLVQVASLPVLDDFSLANKFTYFDGNYDQDISVNLSGLKFMVLACLVALLSSRYLPRRWSTLVVASTIMYIVFLPLPLLPFRAFLIFTCVLTGYVLSFSALKYGWNSLIVVSGLYAFYLSYKQMASSPADLFRLWSKFDWVGLFPFYYFLK